jgi:UDP-N-acetyl-D-mannosaminuronic acid transferase (WecB/TagA/CpsF family)
MWMQRRGITWLFRLSQEPGRLLGRYLRYNSWFLWLLFVDAARAIGRRIRKFFSGGGG